MTKVLSKLPTPRWIKVNTDSSSRGKPSRSSIGYCLREEGGDMRYAYGREIQYSTNTEAKTFAILDALRYCVDHYFTYILLQTDSMLITNAIEGTWTLIP